MRKREALSGFGWNALFTLINRIGLPLIGVVLAALIGPAGFGDYAALNSTYVIIELFREAGLGLTFISDKEISAQRERTYNFLSVLNGLVFATVLFLSRNWIADRMEQRELSLALAVLSFGMVIGSLGTVPALKLTRAGRFRDVGLVDTATNLTSMIVAVVSFKLGAGFMALVYQMASRSILFCILTNYVSPAAWGRPSLTQAKQIMGTAIANMGANIAYTIYTMGDYVLVRVALGPVATGIYTFAYNIACKPVEIVTGPLRNTMLVAFSRDQDDHERLSRNFGRALGAAFLLSIPVYSLILFNAHAIIKIFPGESFDEAALFLQLLCSYLFMRSTATIGSVALIAAKKERWTVYGWIPAYIVAITYIALRLPPAMGDWKAGLTEIVIGLSLGAISCYSVYLYAAFRFIRPPDEVIRRIWRFIGVGVIAFAYCGLVAMLPVHEYARFGIAAVGAFVIPIALVSKMLLGRIRVGFTLGGVKRVFHEL